MPDYDFGGRGYDESYTDGSVYSDGIPVPKGRLAYNGKHPIIVTALRGYAKGRGGTRTGHMVLSPDTAGSNTSLDFQITAGTVAASTPFVGGLSAFYADGATNQRFAMYFDDFFYYDSGGSGHTTNNHGTVYNGTLGGTIRYIESPTGPQNFDAYGSDAVGAGGKVYCTWTAPADDGGTPLTGYNLYEDGVLIPTTQTGGAISGTATSAVITGYASGETHTFSIRAKNKVTDQAGTTGTSSSYNSATARGITTAPQTVKATPDAAVAGRVTVSWAEPSNIGGDATTDVQYTVVASNGVTPASYSGLTAVFNNLSVGESLTFTVRATNLYARTNSIAGTAATSSAVIVPGPPSAPIGVSAATSATTSARNIVTWSPPSTTGAGGITSYDIYSKVGSTTTVTNVIGTTTSWNHDNLVVGSSYSYTIYARNAFSDANSLSPTTTPALPPSNTVTAIANGFPSAPQNLTATASTDTYGRIILTWTAPATTGTGGITFYNVYVDGSTAVNQSIAGNTLTATVDGLTQNVSHSFTVRARNAFSDANSGAMGPGPASTTATAIAPGPPGAPTNLTAVASQDVAGLITLNWTAPAVTNGTLTKYSVYYSGGALIGDTANGTTTTYQVTGRDPGQTYSFQVRAWNAVGVNAATAGPPSNTASATALGAATAPYNVTVTANANIPGRLTLAWTPPPGTLTGISVYRNGTKIAFVQSSPYVDDGLTPGVPYYYYLAAANVATPDGTPSATVAGTPGRILNQAVTNSPSAVNVTNQTLAGQYIVTSTTSNTISYTAPSSIDLPQATMSGTSGTIRDLTNVPLNGSYFVTTPATNKFSYTKSDALTVPQTTVTGTAHNATNAMMAGSYSITSYDSLNKVLVYSVPTPNVSAVFAVHGTNATDPVAVPANPQTSVTDKSSSDFNGTNLTITSVPHKNELVYNKTGVADRAASTASGTITNLSNTNYYNGVYPVLKPGTTTFQYNRVAPNLVQSLTNLAINPGMAGAGGTFTLRTNICTNPSFETNFTGWSPASGITPTLSTDYAYSGTTSLLVTKTTLGPQNLTYTTPATLTIGAIYTASAYVRNAAGDSKPYITVTGIGSSAATTITNTAWTRLQYTFTATATSHDIAIVAGTATIANSSFYLDAVLIEASGIAGIYFDGSSAAGDLTYAWTGTAHASSSTATATAVAYTTNTADALPTTYAKGYRSSNWSDGSPYSLAMVNQGSVAANQYVNLQPMLPGLVANTDYTLSAVIYTTESVSNPTQLKFVVQGSTTPVTVSTGISGPPGAYHVSLNFNTGAYPAAGYVRFVNELAEWGLLVYLDSLMVVQGKYTGTDVPPYFTGSSPNTAINTYAWTGAVNASTSTRTSSYLMTQNSDINDPYGDVARTDNQALVDILYRPGWLG